MSMLEGYVEQPDGSYLYDPQHRRGGSKWVPGMKGFTPRSDRYLSSPNSQRWLSAARRNVGRQCEVEDCWAPVERGGRLCFKHRNAKRARGHPTGSNLPRRMLGPWAAAAMSYLGVIDRQPEGNPARSQLALARHYLTVRFAQSQGFEGLGWRPGQSHEVRLKRHLANLRRHGVTPDRLLALIVAFYCAREFLAVLEDQDHERFQLGRLILQTVSLPLTYHGRPEDHGFRYLVWLGQLLMEQFGTFAAWTAHSLLTGKGQAGWPDPVFPTPTKAEITKAIKRTVYRPLSGDEDQD
jgi:hypothetical protein